jgi:cytochrome c oxidase assembly protein subunit 15
METHKIVKVWLLIGLLMLFVQVIVGGITRLTGSGLSITKWEIVTGTLPPMSEKEWEEEFDLYKSTPQYREINEGMEMGSVFESGTFKFIYFWEWVHRLWARTMGFVFLFPLMFFMYKRWIRPPLLKRLTVVFLLAGLAASFGWIMVASGLVERPWVNAYKLSLHLCIAFLVYGYLLWTFFHTVMPEEKLDNVVDRSRFRKVAMWFTAILCIQIFFGGIMSGMKAGVVFPTWPDMNGELIPQIVFNSSEWNVNNFNYYDRNIFMPALIHLLHRGVAYVLFILGIVFFYKVIKTRPNPVVKRGIFLLVILLITQVMLGIITVINCQGSIPVFYGVMHQAVALCLLTSSLFMNFRFK